MERIVTLACGVAISVLAGFPAYAEKDDGNCRKAANFQSASLVSATDGKVLSGVGGLPEQLNPTTTPKLRVCIPVRAAMDGQRGVINIRLQFFTQAQESTEPSNKVRLQNSKKKTPYPSVSISTYQRYHGCKYNPHPVLDDEFHLSLDGASTRADPWRRNFVFSSDEEPECGIPGRLVEFGRRVPVVGTAVNTIFPPAYANEFVRPETIVDRKSIITAYPRDFDKPSTSTNDASYISYEFRTPSSGRCVRVEVTRIFKQGEFGTIAGGGTQVAGVVCASASE